MELRPAVGVCLVEVEVGAVVVTGPAGVALAADGVRGALDGGFVFLTDPVAQSGEGGGGGTGRLAQLAAQRVGTGGCEIFEPPSPLAIGVDPLIELVGEGGGGPGAAYNSRSSPRARLSR